MARQGAKYQLTVVLTSDDGNVDENWYFDVQVRKGNFINYTPYELATIAKEGAKKALQDLDRVKVSGLWGDTH
jgi:hypothetical protein